MKFWEEAGALHCRTWRLVDDQQGMAALRAMFPKAEADGDNLVMFSTSGVHGTYLTIEEEQADPCAGVTFLIIKPRLVVTHYGVAHPKTEEDFAFLKKLRATSWTVMSEIGA